MKNNDNYINRTFPFVDIEAFSDLAISKVEKVSDRGNYYCIWIAESFFYLFQNINKQFALKSNSIEKAHKFVKTENYSEISHSFIAYRYTKSYVHIIYDDGYIEEKTFKFVGEEHNGIRAVKTTNDRWFFYDTIKRRIITLTGKNGYKLSKDYYLSEIIADNVFTVKNSLGRLSLVFKIPNQEPIFFKEFFSMFCEAPKGTIIGKLYGKEIYTIIKFRNLPEVVGYYNKSPKYIPEHNLFVAQKGNNWCVVKGKREIQNCQWKEPHFFFIDGYILNRKDEYSSWNLYSSETGQLIPNNWKNIRVDVTGNQGTGIIVDTENSVDIKIKSSDISKESSNIIQSIIKDIKNVANKDIQNIHEKNNQNQQRPNVQNDIVPSPIGDNLDAKSTVCTTSNVKDDNHSSNVQEVPKSIDYFVFVKRVVIHDDFITNRINCTEITDNSCIAWIVLEAQQFILTEYHCLGIHRVICKTNKEVDKLCKYGTKYRVNQPNRTNVHISKPRNNIIDPNNCIIGLYQKIKLLNEVKTTEISIQEEKVPIAIQTKLEESSQINENILTTKNEILSVKTDVPKSELPVRNEGGTLGFGEVFKDGHALFTRRRYIKSGNNIYILFHPEEDKICSSEDDCDYHIKGEGKDPRFDQNFGQNSNGMLRDSIGDSNIRCFIFKRDKDNSIVLLDRVKCVDCTYETEKDTNRLIIIFKMQSLRNDTDFQKFKDNLIEDAGMSMSTQSKLVGVNNSELTIQDINNGEGVLVALRDIVISFIQESLGQNKSLNELEVNIKYTPNGVLNYSLASNNNIIKGDLRLDSPNLLKELDKSKNKKSVEFVREAYTKKKDVNIQDGSYQHKLYAQHGISYYVECFSSLHVFKQRGQIAPHKAILLLSVLDLVANGSVNLNKIEFSEKLEEQFIQNWKQYVRKDSVFHSVPSTPFWYMQSEPFWKLVPRSGGVNSIYGLKQCAPSSSISLRNCILHAEIDEELFVLMQNVWNRQKLRKVLLNTYLSIK